MPAATKAARKKITTGEKTKRQSRRGIDTAAGVAFDFPSFGRAPKATIETYRKMRSNPTIALARLAATAPIRGAEFSYTADADGIDEMVDFVRGVFEPMRPRVVKESLRALDYGWQSFEKVWAHRESDGRFVLRKIKPLLPELTRILIEKKTGEFAGLKQSGVDLSRGESFLFTYDGEAGNLYGRARHENVREVWNAWEDTLTKIGRYVSKVSGAIPIIRYPPGQAEDASGTKTDNFEIAKALIDDLGKLNGIAHPATLAAWASDLARAGVDVEKLFAWQISFLESKGQHGGDLTSTMRYLDSLLVRGWLSPERSITEGQSGTKAEAAEHGDLVIVSAEELLDELVWCINQEIINPLLVANFGRGARNLVRLEHQPLVDEKAALVRKIVEAVLTNPSNLQLLVEILDLDAMLDQTGIPASAEEFDIERLREIVKPAPAPAPMLPGPDPFAFSPSLAASMQAVYGDLHAQLAEMTE